MAVECTHLDQVQVLQTDKDYCEECVKTGDSWVHLRMCLICGHVGCCDSSPNRHASKHYHASSHPLVRSLEPGESWVWCYADDVVAGEIEE
ncbi:UBP-type zinc finger domain-containing protein [Noviherbaspirillum sp.]|uniref:UBP-type zinc finger domain-containing protein n=1 Tax=Noviherbaspirillum sp. TaxID=1926288 RepID=UPI002B49ABFA|nr:UBP-type zinc finger domain-containing protein [Noviherbaspirillum sp.]HJV79905.1 UBP-type zinc finger domain-containing protein [Noviherbaspirillum sp.]HJW05228.1 UBP-type zinc finger domain-containing protein [Rhodanobacter sp.]